MQFKSIALKCLHCIFVCLVVQSCASNRQQVTEPVKIYPQAKEDKIALKCNMPFSTSNEFGNHKLTENHLFNQTLLINYADSTISSFQQDSISNYESPVFAPKIISFAIPEIPMVVEIDRETLAISVNYKSEEIDWSQSPPEQKRWEVQGRGICQKIRYPDMVSPKARI